MRKQIKIRIQLHSYMRTKQITNSTYMKKQILLTNDYTMTTIKVTAESFFSITVDCFKRFTSNFFEAESFSFYRLFEYKTFQAANCFTNKDKNDD